MTGAELTAVLDAHGFDFYTGVPCSLIEDLIATLAGRARPPYVAAVREDAAVGLAGGAWFGGRTPVVLLQNSGLGTSLNALASFTLMYGLPVLLIVTWRGYRGSDAPEHILTGAITEPLLQLLGIPHRVLTADTASTAIAWARHEMDARAAPVALLVPPGLVVAADPASDSPSARAQRSAGSNAYADSPSARAQRSARSNTETNRQEQRSHPAPVSAHPRLEPAPPSPLQTIVSGPTRLAPRISRLSALRVALKQLGDEPVVHANGYICRESFSIDDRARNFYMIGSMGLASAIGLGLGLAQPARRVVVLDGDGNLLMNLGTLAMIGGLKPANLVHVVFDNEVYGSTGNQPSPSRDVRLDALAAAAGYRTSAAVADEDAIAGAVAGALAGDGPHFVLVKVTAEEAVVPRIPHTPAQMRDRFRASLHTR
ncbi:MAG TPA: thiamine pyrophosphate-dependent enzyme [Methylomirabilota bacterium]